MRKCTSGRSFRHPDPEGARDRCVRGRRDDHHALLRVDAALFEERDHEPGERRPAPTRRWSGGVRADPHVGVREALGDSLRTRPTVVYQTGDTVPDGGVIWASNDTRIATVDSTGLIRVVGFGETTISARRGDQYGLVWVRSRLRFPEGESPLAAGGQQTAYVCRNFTCLSPAATVEELSARLNE